MTKMSYLRKRMREEYDNRNLIEALNIADALFDEYGSCQPEGHAMADDLFNLAIIYEELGRLEDAASLYYDSAVEICECDLRFLGVSGAYLDMTQEDWLAFAMRINNLAGVCARLGKYMAAHQYFVLANTIYVRFDSPKAIDMVYNMGNLAAATHNTKQALTWHKNALKIRVKGNRSQEDVLHSLHSIAFIYESEGEYKKAIPYAETALKHATGAEHTSAKIYLAELHCQEENPSRALELFEEALEEIKATSHKRSEYLAMLCRRAKLVLETGAPSKAVLLFCEVLEIYYSLTGLDTEELHREFYAECLHNLAVALYAVGKTDTAWEYALCALEARKAAGSMSIKDIGLMIRQCLKNDDTKSAAELIVLALANALKNGNYAESSIFLMLELSQQLSEGEKLYEAIMAINSQDKVLPILLKWLKYPGYSLV